MVGPITRTIMEWRWHWEEHRCDPFDLPSHQGAWEAYVNSLSMIEVLEALQLHEQGDNYE